MPAEISQPAEQWQHLKMQFAVRPSYAEAAIILFIDEDEGNAFTVGEFPSGSESDCNRDQRRRHFDSLAGVAGNLLLKLPDSIKSRIKPDCLNLQNPAARWVKSWLSILDKYAEASMSGAEVGDGWHVSCEAIDVVLQWLSPTSSDAAHAGQRRKKSTAPGEARVKIIAALTAWHQYENGSCGKWESIGLRTLATDANVSPGSVHRFFKTEPNNQPFGTHQGYQVACNDQTKLLAALVRLNNDFDALARLQILPSDGAIDPRER